MSSALALIGDDAAKKEESLDEALGGALFSMRRPRNATAGVSSGLKSAAKGVGMGVVGLVAAPMLGAKENGIKGFLAGLGAVEEREDAGDGSLGGSRRSPGVFSGGGDLAPRPPPHRGMNT